jgi:hypothetical protein
MTSRQQLSPDDWARISRLGWLADTRSGRPEAERLAALEQLLTLHRIQVEEFKRGEREIIDPPLYNAIVSFGVRIFAQADPLDAMAKFLGRKRERGKRGKNSRRDFDIALKVVEKKFTGISLEDAAVAVAKDFGLSPERIENIYKTNHKAAKAQFALALENLSAADPLQAQSPKDAAVD